MDVVTFFCDIGIVVTIVKKEDDPRADKKGGRWQREMRRTVPSHDIFVCSCPISGPVGEIIEFLYF